MTWRELPTDKGEARRAVRATRRARDVDPSARQADAARSARALRERWAGRRPGTLAAFRSLPTEPECGGIIDAAHEAGWQVIVPVMLEDKDLSWVEADAPGRLLGVDAIGRAAIVVVPALAIDRDGMRLGQGGGSYDRALPRRSRSAWTVALVHDDELALRVPRDEHDVSVDAVVTPGHGVIDLPLAQAGPPHTQET